MAKAPKKFGTAIKAETLTTMRETMKSGLSLLEMMIEQLKWAKNELDCLEDVQEYLKSARDRFSEVF